MQTLTTPSLNTDSSNPDVVDFSKYFIPEELTPLYFTPSYGNLTEAQRLRYNQLTGLYFNEQIMFLEKILAENIIYFYLSEPIPNDLKARLRQFILEEKQHTAMFLQLNRQCAPQFYAEQDFYFIQVPKVLSKLTTFLSKRPQWFPLFLWLVMLQEERSLFCGQIYLKSHRIESHFLEVQKRHLKDEVDHIRWDKELINWVWPKTNFVIRKLNTYLLAWLINEYFSFPKRSAVRVVKQLTKEFPSLQSRFQDLRNHLFEVSHNTTFRSFLYTKENVPETFKLFRNWPEFEGITKLMPGNIPRE
jgi:rubrerythrin